MKNFVKFKQHFKNLNYYSMPSSILFTSRKRIHFLLYVSAYICLFIFTIL